MLRLHLRPDLDQVDPHEVDQNQIAFILALT